MKNPSPAKSPIASIEGALANLASRRETLEARLADANSRLEAARSARKNALASDPGADLSSLTRAVRDGEDEVETLRGVLADLAEQVMDHERQLAEASDTELRATAAKQLEKVAGSFDAAADELDAALASVGKAAAKMVAALPSTLQVAKFSDSPAAGQSEQERLVAVILGEGLAHVFPAAFPVKFWGAAHQVGHVASMHRHFGLNSERISNSSLSEDLAAVTAREAAAAVVSNRLRDRAQRIVAGELSPDLADVAVVPPVPAIPRIPRVEVFALKHFAFRLEQGQAPEIVTRRWVHLVPEDAAKAAVAAGVALRTDTPEGMLAFAGEKAQRASTRFVSVGFGAGVGVSDCVDLGVIRRPAPLAGEQEAAAA